MRLVKQVYIYFITYFVIAGISFLSISILTNNIDPGDYGIINLYSSFIIVVVPFVSLGISYPVSVEYYKRDKQAYQSFFTNAQALSLLGLLFVSVIVLIFCKPLSRFIHVDTVWILLLPVSAWVIMNYEIVTSLFRIRNKPVSFAVYSISKHVGEIVLTIILVVGLGWAWQGRLLSGVITSVIVGLVAVFFFYRWNLIKPGFSIKEIKALAWTSFPFIFERLSIFIMSNSDRYFIDKYEINGTDKVGLYSVGAQVAAIIYLVIVSLNSAYQPYIFQKLSTGERERAKRITLIYMGGATVIVAGIMGASPLLFKFFIGEQFSGAGVFVYYLCTGYFMWSLYNAFLPYLLFHRKSRIISYISIAGVVICLGMNFYMVPRYGAYGAAITIIVTYGIMMLLCMLFAWKYFNRDLPGTGNEKEIPPADNWPGDLIPEA